MTLNLRTEVEDLQLTNEALLQNLEIVKEKNRIEKEEVEISKARAIRTITEELSLVRERCETSMSSMRDAHSKTVQELQEMIEELIAARAAESNFAKEEADRLNQELSQLMNENMECFRLLQTLVPKSELDSARCDPLIGHL